MSSDGSAGAVDDDRSMSSRSSYEDSTAADAAPDAPHEAELATLPAADLVDRLYRNPGREDLFDEAAHVLAARDRRLAEAEAELHAAHKAADRLLDDISEQEGRRPDLATMTEAWLKDEVRAREGELRGAHRAMDALLDEISKERSDEIGVRDRRLAEAEAQISRAAETEAGLRAELEARDRAIAALEAELDDLRRRHVDDARRPPPHAWPAGDSKKSRPPSSDL